MYTTPFDFQHVWTNVLSQRCTTYVQVRHHLTLGIVVLMSLVDSQDESQIELLMLSLIYTLEGLVDHTNTVWLQHMPGRMLGRVLDSFSRVYWTPGVPVVWSKIDIPTAHALVTALGIAGFDPLEVASVDLRTQDRPWSLEPHGRVLITGDLQPGTRVEDP